jgi:mannose-6-phosphate isomerase-like protein (cupin superfamily)
MSKLAHKRLGEKPDAIAPDGTAVRLLAALDGGSFAHFELPAGAVSHAVAHRTVEEIWFFLGGTGDVWRKLATDENVVAVQAGDSLTIPLGAHFQFRANESAPLAFVAVTMPPWPGEGEAEIVEGRWPPTVESGAAID